MKNKAMKFTALFLVLALMLATLAACGDSSDDSETTTSGSDETTTTAEQDGDEETEAQSEEVTKDDIIAYFTSLETATADGLNTYESSYDDIVAYLIEQGAIAEDAEPVDIFTTEGYLTDNTGGSFPYDTFADLAYDYDGVYLLWWDLGGDSEFASNYSTLQQNGIVVISGGAALFESVSVVSGCYALGFSADVDEDTVASVTEIFNGIDSTAYSLTYMTSAMDLINSLVSAGLVDSSEIANVTDLNAVYSYPTTTADWVGYDVSESGYGDPYDSTGYCYLATTAYQVGSVCVYYYDTLSGLYDGNLTAVYDELTASGTISPYCVLEWDGEWQPYTYDGDTTYAEDGEVLSITVDGFYGRFAIVVEE